MDKLTLVRLNELLTKVMNTTVTGLAHMQWLTNRERMIRDAIKAKQSRK